MTDKELRRMSRVNLIDIIYQLQKSEALLKEDNARLTEALADRELRIEKLGSIAEAALALNNVFEAAQAAADQYLAEAKARAEAIVDNARENLVCTRPTGLEITSREIETKTGTKTNK